MFAKNTENSFSKKKLLPRCPSIGVAVGGATSWPVAAKSSGIADMDPGGGSTGSQHSRSGYSLATAAPAAKANSIQAAANMTAAAVRLSVVHHWPVTGRPRVSIKRRRLRSAILEAVTSRCFSHSPPSSSSSPPEKLWQYYPTDRRCSDQRFRGGN